MCNADLRKNIINDGTVLLQVLVRCTCSTSRCLYRPMDGIGMHACRLIYFGKEVSYVRCTVGSVCVLGGSTTVSTVTVVTITYWTGYMI